MKSKVLIKNIFLFILLGSCIASMSGYALSTTDYDISMYLLMVTFFCLLFYIKYPKTFSINSNNKTLILWFMFLFFSGLSLLTNFSMTNLNAYLAMMLIITVAFFISEALEFNIFVDTYIKIMKVLTIIAILAHFILIVLGLKITLPIIQNSNGAEFLNGFLFFIRVHATNLSSRSMSIFWEPGLYSSFLIFALIFELCFKKSNPNLFNIIIFVSGIFIAQSTAGYLLLTIMFGVFFFSKARKGDFLLFYFFIFMIIYMYLNIDNVINYLIRLDYDTFYKIQGDIFIESTRYKSGLLNLYIFSQKPLLGMGFASANNIFTSLMLEWKLDAQTSTSTYYLAAMGIPGIVYTISWIWSVLNLNKLSIYTRILILLAVLIIINKEPHESNLFTYCMLFYFTREAYTTRNDEEK